MNIGTLLVIIGTILAALSAFFTNRVAYMLHFAVVLIGLGILMGAAKVLTGG